MVMGMITTMVLIFGVFGFGSDKIVNEEYNAEQMRRKELREEAERADSLDELTIRLTELGNQPTASFNEAAVSCQQRIALANEIIERGPTDEPMRETAVCEGILAHIKLFGLDYTQNMELRDIGADLEAAYTPYLDDENKEIYEHARVALLTHRSFQKIKSGGQEAGDLVDLFSDTINRFTDNEYVASMIEAHLFVIVGTEPAYAKKLYGSLLERHPPSSLEPAMASMMYNMSDRLLLHDEDFKRKVDDRWANGLAGRRELVKTCTRLLGQAEIGDLLIRKLLSLGHWFERNDFFEESKSIYDEILSSAKVGNILPAYREAASRGALAGLKRLSLVDKTIDFQGVDVAGKQLMDDEVKQNVVVVVYWSVDSPESIQCLGKLNQSRAFGNKPISILAVCADEETPDEVKQMRKSSRMQIIEPAFGSGKNSLLEACPPGSLPHVMLVGFGGKVYDINADPDPDQVKNKALSLLLDRGR